jgi:hypothetical protein
VDKADDGGNVRAEVINQAITALLAEPSGHPLRYLVMSQHAAFLNVF